MKRKQRKRLAVNASEIKYYEQGLAAALAEREKLGGAPPPVVESERQPVTVSAVMGYESGCNDAKGELAVLQEDNAALSVEVEKLTAKAHEAEKESGSLACQLREANRVIGWRDATISELTAKVEAVESGAAFVGEEYQEGDQIECGLYLKQGDWMFADRMHSGGKQVGKDGWRYFRWDGPTSFPFQPPRTAPLPAESEPEVARIDTGSADPNGETTTVAEFLAAKAESEPEPASPPPAKPDCLADIQAVLCEHDHGNKCWVFGGLDECGERCCYREDGGYDYGFFDCNGFTPVHWDRSDPAACRLAAEIGGSNG